MFYEEHVQIIMCLLQYLKVAHCTQWRTEWCANGATPPGIQSKVGMHRVKLQKLKGCSKMIFPIIRLLTYAA